MFLRDIQVSLIQKTNVRRLVAPSFTPASDFVQTAHQPFFFFSPGEHQQLQQLL